MMDVIVVNDTKHGFLAICSTMDVAQKSVEFSYHKAVDKPLLTTNRYEVKEYMLPDNTITLTRKVVQEEVEHL